MASLRVLIAPDSYKGTATAHEVAAALGHACWDADVDAIEVPMSDGGDGLIDVLGGPNRTSRVNGPLGVPVDATWRLHRDTAVIEMARASGLVLAGGAERNRPLDASTEGVGQLIDHALDAAARRIVVGLGGSATTDGGYGAVRAINGIARLENVELLVACDVTTPFLDAARVFGPQKGATPAQVKMLSSRLERLAQMFQSEFDADVIGVEGGGAAGGLGGALAALGGRLIPGVELVADELDLFDHLDPESPDLVDLVVTGEGRLDATSFRGKVVGGVSEFAAEAGVPTLAVVGTVDPAVADALPDGLEVLAVSDVVGEERSIAEPRRSITAAFAGWLAERDTAATSR
ncbi:MAG: glycerate kinase [Actinomycetota bacterium]